MKAAAGPFPTSFPDLLRGLEQDLNELCQEFSPEAGFTAFLLERLSSPEGWPAAIGKPQPFAAWSALRRHDYAPELAAAGYFLSTGLLPDDAMEPWREGFSRLAARDAFPPDRGSFVNRPEELFGICLGAKHCLAADDPNRLWLSGVLVEQRERADLNQIWDYLCTLLATDSLGTLQDWGPLSLRSAPRWSLDEVALTLLVVRSGEADGLFEGVAPQTPEHLRGLTLEKFFHYDPALPDGGKRAAIYAAVRSSYGEMVRTTLNMTTNPSRKPGTKVFIGHGRSPLWMELDKFITTRLKLPTEEFNSEPTAGLTTAERLEAMLDDAACAFLVFTAEDEHHDNTKHARENVIHEQGLFQGKLGRRRAIILLEEGCAEFSNIVGQSQLRFPRGNIRAQFEEVRRVLEREGLLTPS